MKTTILPEPDEIMRRLTAANDLHWNIEHFYPRIAKAGGTERAGFGLPLLFELAIADVCDGDPLASTLRLLVPSWMRAIVDDPEVLAEALGAFREMFGPLEA
jgi:hypothetical protein